MNYDFPVTDPLQARDVLELKFPIDPTDETVYANLDAVRPPDYLKRISYSINIIDKKLVRPSDVFKKILFLGHLGCGKSIELQRFHAFANDPKRYSSIFIGLEQETEIATFQPEDFFVLLIAKFVERMNREKIKLKSSALDEILKGWMSDKTIEDELKTNYQLDIGSDIEAGTNFFGFLKLATRLKALFSQQSQTREIIRRKVTRNALDLIKRFNRVLDEARSALQRQKKGTDFLFVIDGFDKMPYEIYKRVFISEPHLIEAIEANMIFSIRITSWYDIQNNPQTQFFNHYLLPMVKVNHQSEPILAQILAKRVAEALFFEPKALSYIVKQSGGCPRQLLRLAHRALVINLGKRITRKVAKLANDELALSMWAPLESEHIERLQSGDYKTADPKVLELLLNLVVITYNGERKINPIITDAGLLS